MLGLSSTVSSGSTLESLYSITLDGTDDYIDLGTGINLGTVDFTISLWVKTADFHNKYFISEFVDAENRWFLHTNSVDPPQLHFVQEIGNTAHTTYVDTSGSTNLDNLQNAWTHLAISADRDGNVIGYVNGVAGSAVSGQATSLTTTANTFIGRYSSTYSAIQIDEVAIWNAALNEDNITAIYNSGRPTNLTLNSGNYNQSSALQAYYRMGNGTFDDKANGVIHDQNSSGFESSSLYASDYTSGVDGWTGFGEGVVAGNIDGIVEVDNCLRYTSNSDVGDTRAFLKSDVLTIGKVYKVTFSYYIPSGSNVDALILDTVAGPDDDTRNTVQDAWTTVTEYFTARTADIKIILGDADQYLNPAATDDIAYIKDVSVTNQKIGAGFGAELVTDGDFPNGDNWTISGGNAEVLNGKLNFDDAAENGTSVTNDATVVSGKTYLVNYTISDYAGGSSKIRLGTQFGPTRNSVGDFSEYIVSDGTEIRIYSASDNTTLSIDNISLKQLNGIPGLTSDANGSGFNFTSDTP